MYIGMDLHKNHIQVAAIDKKGQLLYNSKIDNNKESLEKFFGNTDRGAKVVMVSSSVWCDTYHSMESIGFNTILSNPIKTKAIASARIKTDRIDAKVLAELLRADLIPACYIPPKEIMQLRQLVRHREFLVRQRTKAGVCHSDVHFKSGEWQEYLPAKLPVTIGHEMAGTIDRLGPNTRDVQKGDAVAVFGGWACGFCRHCKSGNEQLCDRPTFPGLSQYDGGYAEYVLVPSYKFLVNAGNLDPKRDSSSYRCRPYPIPGCKKS